MAKKIRLTENELRNVVAESVKRVLKEMEYGTAGYASGRAARQAANPSFGQKINDRLGGMFGKTSEDYANQSARIRQMGLEKANDADKKYYDKQCQLDPTFAEKFPTFNDYKYRGSSNTEDFKYKYDNGRSGGTYYKRGIGNTNDIPKFGNS